ncbi:hypothetical protein SUDANB1_05595 [Streptomyces sp. enrichment culture]|uniref:hypothetical protein n=1 Tax=Streptomyces sp. enrichment culture TaxID=1795815 RepID=UPI003F5727B2
MPSMSMTPYCRAERDAARASLAALVRSRQPDDPEIAAARRAVAALRAKALLLAAVDALAEATNPKAPDFQLPQSLASSAAEEITRRLDVVAG